MVGPLFVPSASERRREKRKFEKPKKISKIALSSYEPLRSCVARVKRVSHPTGNSCRSKCRGSPNVRRWSAARRDERTWAAVHPFAAGPGAGVMQDVFPGSRWEKGEGGAGYRDGFSDGFVSLGALGESPPAWVSGWDVDPDC
jgi:hypothetical protein